MRMTMDREEIDRRMADLNAGYAELERETIRARKMFELVVESLAEHRVRTVEELPLFSRKQIVERLNKTATQEWLDFERARLDRLSAELLPHVSRFFSTEWTATV